MGYAFDSFTLSQSKTSWLVGGNVGITIRALSSSILLRSDPAPRIPQADRGASCSTSMVVIPGGDLPNSCLPTETILDVALGLLEVLDQVLCQLLGIYITGQVTNYVPIPPRSQKICGIGWISWIRHKPKVLSSYGH